MLDPYEFKVQYYETQDITSWKLVVGIKEIARFY